MVWFAKEFLSYQSICISVEEKDLQHTLGFCTELEDEFLIEININQSEVEKLRTFFHELYHVVQHLDNQPRDEDECITFESVLLDRWLRSL